MMGFEFKRKYDYLFIFTIILLIICIGLTFVVKAFVDNGVLTDTAFKPGYMYTLIWLNFVLCILAYITLSHKKYYININGFSTSKPLSKTIIIDFSKFVSVTRNPNDKVFLFFGNQPSITLTYQHKRKLHKIVIRSTRSELLYKFLTNEKDISKELLKDEMKNFA